MLNVVENIYLPNLKFIGYELDPDSGTVIINTHAPFGMKDIKLLADYLQVELSLDEHLTVGALIKAINEINTKVIDVINNGMLYAATHEGEAALTENIITKMMWQRVGNKYDETNFITNLNGINFKYRHGHDQPNFQPPDHIQVLDNMRGKSSEVETDNDMILLSGATFYKKYQSHLRNVISDYTMTRGINCIFYKKLDKYIRSLDELVNHQGVGLFDNSQRDMMKINVLRGKIEEKIRHLPPDQKESYNALYKAATNNLSSGITHGNEDEPDVKRSRIVGNDSPE
jgi:hypothetical protein